MKTDGTHSRHLENGFAVHWTCLRYWWFLTEVWLICVNKVKLHILMEKYRHGAAYARSHTPSVRAFFQVQDVTGIVMRIDTNYVIRNLSLATVVVILLISEVLLPPSTHPHLQGFQSKPITQAHRKRNLIFAWAKMREKTVGGYIWKNDDRLKSFVE